MDSKKYITLLDALNQVKQLEKGLPLSERKSKLEFAESYVFVDSIFSALSKNLKMQMDEIRSMYYQDSTRILINALRVIKRRMPDSFDKDVPLIERYKRFRPWLELQPQECHYCGLTEQQIEVLISNGYIESKRLETRGRSLEIDKKNPNGSYLEDNIVLSCYWCNNAKTDTFSYVDFKTFIGPAFKELWKHKMALYNECSQ